MSEKVDSVDTEILSLSSLYEVDEIIAETDDLVVINKPSSLPVHPCGAFRHNCIMFIMAADYATVTSDLADGKTDSLVSKHVGAIKTTDSKGKFADATPTGNVASGSQDFYLIVLNSGTLADATAFATSAKTTMTIDASLDTTIAFGSMKDATQATASWTAIAAPEPTSGLLLLLGVAGLALKRKRA